MIDTSIVRVHQHAATRRSKPRASAPLRYAVATRSGNPRRRARALPHRHQVNSGGVWHSARQSYFAEESPWTSCPTTASPLLGVRQMTSQGAATQDIERVGRLTLPHD